MYERLKREGDYLLIFRHDISGGAFTSNAEALSIGTHPDTDLKFSVLNYLEEFRRQDGKFQFRLHYPEENITNIWKQSSNFASFGSGNYLRNGLFAGGEGVEDAVWAGSGNSIIEMPNPGSSDYVLRQEADTGTSYYRIYIPQSRLQAGKSYQFMAWVGFDSEADHDLDIGLAQGSYQTSNGTVQFGDRYTSGTLLESTGSAVLIDGVYWQRKYMWVTLDESMTSSGTLTWDIAYIDATNRPTGNIYLTNIMMLDGPLIRNYMGDYQPTAGGVTGLENISIEDSATDWGGLEYNGSRALADGSKGGYWWYAIGTTEVYQGGMPGPNKVVQVVELWVYAPVSMTVREDGLLCKSFNENNGHKYTIKTRGVGSIRTELPSVTVNGSELLNSAVINSTSGLGLAHINNSGVIDFQAAYNVSNATVRNNFINQIKSFTDGIYCIFSGKTVTSDSVLDDFMMNEVEALNWKGVNFYAKYNHRFAAIGLGKTGEIVSSQSTADDVQEVYPEPIETINRVLELGSGGYGEPLFEAVDYPSNATETLTCTNMSNRYLLMHYVGKRAIGAPVEKINVRFYNSNGTLLNTYVAEITSTSFLEKYEHRVLTPINTAYAEIDHQGNAVIKSISVYKAGEYEATDDINPLGLSEYAASNKNLVLAPISVDPMKSQKLVDYYLGSNNIHKGALVQGRVDDTIFGEVDISSTAYRVVSSSAASRTFNDNANASFPIENDRLYFVSCWQMSDGITTGGDAIVVETEGTSGEIARTNAGDKDDGEFVLLSGWLIPSHWSQGQIDEFMDQYQSFYGVYGDTSVPSQSTNGLGAKHSSYVQMIPSDSTVKMMYSRTSNGYSHLCLPQIAEVTVAGIGQDTTFALNVSESKY